MKICIKATALFSVLLLLLTPTAYAQELGFSLIDATPIGSWQLREDTVIDHKGRQSLNVIRTSLLSKESRDGQQYYWLEMAIDTYKLKKNGKRKKSGDKVVLKSLVATSALTSDAANVMNNLSSFGKEMIMQNGNSKPMRISGSGMMAQSMLKALGAKVNYSYQTLGKENVSVKAGSFNATKIQGSGSTSVKVVFKKMTIESDNTAWLSSKVPFGLVKGQGVTETNGKKSTHSVELVEFGTSGAVSQITGTPEEMPEMPDLKGLFGG